MGGFIIYEFKVTTRDAVMRAKQNERRIKKCMKQRRLKHQKQYEKKRQRHGIHQPAEEIPKRTNTKRKRAEEGRLWVENVRDLFC